LELYFNDSMQNVYARSGGGGSRQRQVADGADVVFTDTASDTSAPPQNIIRLRCVRCIRCGVSSHPM